jgi:hypothetical protein
MDPSNCYQNMANIVFSHIIVNLSNSTFPLSQTYRIRLPSITGYDSAGYILDDLMKKYRSTKEVIFVNLYRLHSKVGYCDGRTRPGLDSNQRSLSYQDRALPN